MLCGDGEQDGVRHVGWHQNTDIAAVCVVLRNAVLAVQQSPADRVPTVISDIDGVLCKADVVWQFLVTDASRLDQQSEVQILAVLRKPGALQTYGVFGQFLKSPVGNGMKRGNHAYRLGSDENVVRTC